MSVYNSNSIIDGTITNNSSNQTGGDTIHIDNRLNSENTSVTEVNLTNVIPFTEMCSDSEEDLDKTAKKVLSHRWINYENVSFYSLFFSTYELGIIFEIVFIELGIEVNSKYQFFFKKN